MTISKHLLAILFVFLVGCGAPVIDDAAPTDSAEDNLRRGFCGDRRCRSGETCSTCPADCGSCAPTGDLASLDAASAADGGANRAPTVSAGAAQTIAAPASSATLAATASDPDGDALTYAWTQTAGPAATIASPAAATTTVSGLAVGTSTFEVSVSDGRGGSAQAAVQVTVSAQTFSCPSGHRCIYLSTAAGDDTRTLAAAQNPATPWKTLAKLNASFGSLQAGDYVVFNRGEEFPGALNVTKSGTAAAPITFTAYGSGARPVLTGLTTVTGWTATTNGRYEAVLPGGLATANIVTRDDTFQPMGRWPKATAANAGYLRVDSHAGTTSITSTGLASAPSFVGGEIVWRPYHWVLWRGAVGAQSTSTVTYAPFASTSGGAAYPGADGYGFFFQNHPNACTAPGEWAYDGAAHKLTMYFGAAGPGTTKVRASTVDNLVTLNAVSYVVFDGLAFTGANVTAIYAPNASHITIANSDLRFSGVQAVLANGGTDTLVLTGNTIAYSNSNGINASGATTCTITGNTITETGAVAGMGGSGEGQYFGIANAGNGSTIASNTITRSGYIPLNFRGTNVLVQNNLVTDFAFVKDDAGGIYFGGIAATGTKILYNIVLNGIGAAAGTPDGDRRVNGIYADDGASAAEIAWNTVAGCGHGYYNHASFSIDLHDNTFYDNGSAITYYNDTNLAASLKLARNIAVARTTSELLVRASGGSTAPSTWFAAADGNYYCRPFDENNTFSTPSFATTNLAGWRTLTGKEAASKTSPVALSDPNKLRFEYNATSAAKSVSLGAATYVDATGKAYAGAATLQPFTSVVLFQTN